MFNPLTKDKHHHAIITDKQPLDCFAALAMTAVTRIKICGVKSPEIAEAAATLGADYIGLIFHPASKRHLDLAVAKTIAQTTQAAGAIPVAVFVDQTQAEMQMLLDSTGITTLQLHGNPAKSAHRALDSHYTRIYVQAVHHDGQFEGDTTAGLQHCLPERDYVLLDNLDAGQGCTLPWDRLKPSSSFRYGLAGGLNPDNVLTAIAQIKPNFVDVSSGVETSPGNKDITLIANFIQQIRGHAHATR